MCHYHLSEILCWRSRQREWGKGVKRELIITIRTAWAMTASFNVFAWNTVTFIQDLHLISTCRLFFRNQTFAKLSILTQYNAFRITRLTTWVYSQFFSPQANNANNKFCNNILNESKCFQIVILFINGSAYLFWQLKGHCVSLR